jgi:hypothetical protein
MERIHRSSASVEVTISYIPKPYHSVLDFAYTELATTATEKPPLASAGFCINVAPSNIADFVPTKCSMYCRSGFTSMLTTALSNSTPTWVSAEVVHSFDKQPWPPPSQVQVLREQATALQELLTCLMALSVSMDGCALIQELVQWKCSGNYWCSLLEETGQKFRVAGGKAMGHWQAKQDLLQQSLSYDASCTEVLNLKWSIQSQLIGSARVPSLLTVATA